MPLPKISVITPSYNQAQFLERTLHSIHDPGYPNLEHIVIDGGSTDQSVEIIKAWQEKLSYWLSEADNGQTDALIKGFNVATGDILCWLNSDDLFEPWTLLEVAAFFKRNPHAQVVYGDATWIDSEDQLIRLKREHSFSRFIYLYDHDFIPQPSTFWTRSIYDEVSGLDPRFELAMDGDLFIRFADATKMHHIRRLWSRMRLYPDQKNQKFRDISNREEAQIRERYHGSEAYPVLSAKRASARLVRIAVKTMTGCYSVSDIAGRLTPSGRKRSTTGQ